MKEGEINTLFSSFLYYKFLDTDIEKIRKYCYDLRDRDSGRNISNIGGWQSNLLSGEIPELNYLFIQVEKHFNIISANLPINKGDRVNIGDCWININRGNNFNRPHVHPGAILSAVFYLDDFNDGRLILQSPIQNHAYHISNWEVLNDFTSGVNYVHPQSNKLIIFPAWLNHLVEPSASNKDRISLAFNGYLSSN